MIIAGNFSLIAVLGGLALIGVGLGILGWLLSVFVQRFQDPEDDEDTPTGYEPFTASDGKTYWWPKHHKRSSRDNDTQ